jgi:branched-chain amino acid transport system ATP-binding protein
VTEAAGLEVRGLGKRFGGLQAVSRFDLAVAPGEIVGLIGPNGAGKTTVFHLIAGFHEPSEGTIVFDGRSLVGLKPHAICRLGLARTFQLVQPFAGLTTLENVMVGAFNRARDVREARHRAAEIVDFVGLGPRRDSPARHLTLADRKRLEVARGLATGPRLLLLDEVAGGLTDPEVTELVEIVRAINAEGTAIVWIEHVVRALTSLVDRLICLYGGAFVGDGDPATVLADPKVREVYLGSDFNTTAVEAVLDEAGLEAAHDRNGTVEGS